MRAAMVGCRTNRRFSDPPRRARTFSHPHQMMSAITDAALPITPPADKRVHFIARQADARSGTREARTCRVTAGPSQLRQAVTLRPSRTSGKTLDRLDHFAHRAAPGVGDWADIETFGTHCHSAAVQNVVRKLVASGRQLVPTRVTRMTPAELYCSRHSRLGPTRMGTAPPPPSFAYRGSSSKTSNQESCSETWT
jgi:hypothetical protein